MVLAVGTAWLAGILLVQATARILAYLVVALFFTVVLTPAIDFLQQRLNVRRGIATAMVVVAGLALLAGMIYAFVRPLVDQGQSFARDLPTYVKDAQKGRGPVGKIVKRYKLQKYVDRNRKAFEKSASGFGSKGFSVVRKVFSGLVAGITVMVLTILMLLETPKLSQGALALVPGAHRERVRRVAVDAGKAVSGYMTGNLLISLIAGVATYVFLKIAGVPYAEVLALWVAFADLIPLVGATLGAVPTILFCFLHSAAVGIAAIIFFVAYQQFENHVLQVTVMARTVKVNPLTVLVSVLLGVELFGLLGALLAIPAAGVIQVVIRDLWDERSGRLKEAPTTGVEEVPITETP
ncbi:MAG: family transporter [Acidimicrobiales bacterium]|nr:family transporter [Acidimicrobiales bacterium]